MLKTQKIPSKRYSAEAGSGVATRFTVPSNVPEASRLSQVVQWNSVNWPPVKSNEAGSNVGELSSPEYRVGPGTSHWYSKPVAQLGPSAQKSTKNPPGCENELSE